MVSYDFTIREIHKKLTEEVKSEVVANRITVLFKTDSLKNYIVYTKRKQETRHSYKFVSEERKKKRRTFDKINQG